MTADVRFKPFTSADIGGSLRVTVDAFVEDHSYKKTYADDPALVDAFTRMVQLHGLWGWCSVRVRITHAPTGLRADVFLGEASYESDVDFIENSGYYDQMVEEAVEQLNTYIESLLKKLPYHDQA